MIPISRVLLIGTAIAALLLPNAAMSATDLAQGRASALRPERFDQRSAQEPESCAPMEGDLLQGSGPEVYVYLEGALHQIPDQETFNGLGYDPASIDTVADECLESIGLGGPLPSVVAESPPESMPAADSSAPEEPAVSPPAEPTDDSASGRAESTPRPPRTASATPTPPVTVPAPTRSGFAVTLEASATQVSVGTSVTLSARTSRPEGGPFALTIQRIASPGSGPASGLVATCQAKSICTAQVRIDSPSTWTYSATLYACTPQGACFSESDSNKIGVTWK